MLERDCFLVWLALLDGGYQAGMDGAAGKDDVQFDNCTHLFWCTTSFGCMSWCSLLSAGIKAQESVDSAAGKEPARSEQARLLHRPTLVFIFYYFLSGCNRAHSPTFPGLPLVPMGRWEKSGKRNGNRMAKKSV